MWDQPELHDVYRRWHRVLAEYAGDRMTVAEAWTQTPESMARFVRGDEMSQAFNFAWLLAPWSAAAFADVVTGTLAQLAEVDAAPTWVLSNHDVVRHATRYGGGAVGLARARAATLAMLALPGSAYLYQGEELGLEEVDVPPEARQDPAWLRTGARVARRLPGADAVVGRRGAVRLRARAPASRGCRSRPTGRTARSRPRRRTRARRWRSTGPRSRPAASTRRRHRDGRAAGRRRRRARLHAGARSRWC